MNLTLSNSVNFNKKNNYNQVSFGRALSSNEVPECKMAIKQGLKALDKKITVILPDRCTPSLDSENIGIGAFCSYGGKKMTRFLEKIGITGIQRDPGGQLRPAYYGETVLKNTEITGLYKDSAKYIRPFDPCPYISSEDGNEFNISLKQLTKKGFGEILSRDTLKDIVENNPNKNLTEINFGYIDTQMKRALNEAYGTFKEKTANLDKLDKSENAQILKLNKKFNAFKKEFGANFEKTSMYAALSKENGTDIWEKWPKIDKNLYSDASNPKSIERIAQIKSKQADEINFYMFKQFLLHEQTLQKQLFDSKHGITSIADEKVAVSDISVWANQSLFLKGFKLGCPPDMFSKTGQAWGFPVLDPEKIADKDGNLGEAGKFLYQKYKKIFSENKGGVRIDHLIGLIDPFVYPEGKLPIDKGAGRLYSSPKDEKLGKYAKNTVEQYAVILEKIIIPAAKEIGLDKCSIICEDLGTITKPVKAVMKKLQLAGIRVTEYVNPKNANDMFRGVNAAEKDIIMPGSHDNGTLAEYAQDLIKTGDVKNNARYLAKDLLPNASRADRMKFSKEISADENKFISAKNAELFVSPSKHIQIFFKDLLGNDKTRYNTPGLPGSENWNNKLKNNFDKEFFNESLPANKGLNIPQAIATALKTRNGDATLIKKLEYWANVFKEPPKN